MCPACAWREFSAQPARACGLYSPLDVVWQRHELHRHDRTATDPVEPVDVDPVARVRRLPSYELVEVVPLGSLCNPPHERMALPVGRNREYQRLSALPSPRNITGGPRSSDRKTWPAEGTPIEPLLASVVRESKTDLACVYNDLRNTKSGLSNGAQHRAVRNDCYAAPGRRVRLPSSNMGRGFPSQPAHDGTGAHLAVPLAITGAALPAVLHMCVPRVFGLAATR